MGIGKACIAAALALTGMANAASAAVDPALIWPGTFSLQNGEAPYTLADPNASISGDTLSAELWSRPANAFEPALEKQTGSAYLYTPNAVGPLPGPLTFSEIKHFSFDYDIMGSAQFGGGSLRTVMIIDVNNSGVEDAGDQYLVTHLYFVDSIGYTPGLGEHSTGNLIGAPDATSDDWFQAVGGVYADYATTLAAYGNDRVLQINIVHDSANANQVFGISNVVVAVPEPASAGLLALGGLAMLKRRRMA